MEKTTIPCYNITMDKRSKRGMTLIELLVVMAIIGLMVGIAFPVLGYYQKKGQVISDAENMAQVLNHARAFENNPDFVTRDNVTSYTVVKFVRDGNVNKARIFSSADSGKIIDEFSFMTDIRIVFQNNDIVPADDFEIRIKGRTPKEELSCSGSRSCSSNVKIRFFKGDISSTFKDVEIINTNESINQFFAIRVKAT